MKNINLKNLLKFVFYKLNSPRIANAESVKFTYIFHTEAVFDKKYFDELISFCIQYGQITGTLPLATLMSGAHPRIKNGMIEHKINESILAERFHRISEVAVLGYHGHYSFSNDYTVCWEQMRSDAYDIASIREQISKELKWFKNFDIAISPFYSAGWWFQAPELYSLLGEFNFEVDASVSFSSWFEHPNTRDWFKQHGVASGEPVLIDGKILSIQNLIGCHNTAYPEDFVRNILPLLKGRVPESYYFVHSHDFDLNRVYAIETIKRLKNMGSNFIHPFDLIKLKIQARNIGQASSR